MLLGALGAELVATISGHEVDRLLDPPPAVKVLASIGSYPPQAPGKFSIAVGLEPASDRNLRRAPLPGSRA